MSCTRVSATGHPAHPPGSIKDMGDTEDTHVALPPLLRGTLGPSLGANLCRRALLEAVPAGDGAGDVWPARSPLPLMSPPGDQNC